MSTQHRDDATHYASILESTRDETGVSHRDIAVKHFAEDLASDAERIAEYAEARARVIADGFDRLHQPEVDSGQLALDIDTFLVLGESERVSITRANARHTRRWLDINSENHARVAAAWAAKDTHGRRLLAIQEERNCSMWEAECILREGL